MGFSREALLIDREAVTERLVAFLRDEARALRRRGAVVCVSGGIDSAVTLCLAARAFGPERVFAAALPEKESSPESLTYAQALCDKLGVDLTVESITPMLEAHGCYAARDEAIREAIPEFGEGWTSKLVLSGDVLETSRLNVYYVHAASPAGDERRERLSTAAFLRIVAASNLKQRTRMTRGYFHAERLNYLYAGSHNRDEYLLGFSVRYGDIGVDALPLEGLYKVQVYELAEHLGVTREIIERTPSSDTYSADQSQEEFFFALPFTVLDPLLYAWEKRIDARETAAALGLTSEQVERAFRDFESKVRATGHMRELPATVA